MTCSWDLVLADRAFHGSPSTTNGSVELSRKLPYCPGMRFDEPGMLSQLGRATLTGIDNSNSRQSRPAAPLLA
ncbi:MAG: hypothetical protein R3F19_03200 [Verrucomicrobiales bacterium]